ncbi:aprataxin-like protein [Mycoblastus sanguinarius]|nr:aprataxin-like protein [Mycoblastus sanguinarius]
MSPKKLPHAKKVPPSSTPQSDPARTTTFLGRDGLGAYISSPGSFPASRVIYHDEKWVVINDLYPKSSIHILLLPRDPTKQLLHPFEAFEDLEFLREVQAEVKKLRVLVAKELQRRYGKFSALDQQLQKASDALDGDSDSEARNLLIGRDWSTSIISGIHAHPSMNHLHIHVLSIDRQSECMRHRKHYNSFATPFMIDVEAFPLAKGDKRRHPGREGYLDAELKCWRCGKGFGNRFARLKEHLDEEFEAWKKE